MIDEDAPRPVFDNDDRRCKVIPLEWPFTYKGTHYTEIRVRRATTAEFDKYFSDVENAPSDKKDNVRLPVFDIEPEVFDCLDADDADRLDKAALDFLPRRFREEAASGLTPETGEKS